MNNSFLAKVPSLVLLIVMLLNPIVGLAGAFSLGNDLSGDAFVFQENVHEAALMDMSGESCHDRPINSSTLSQTQENSECCEDLCQCEQGACHSPVAAITSSQLLFDSSSPTFYSHLINYRSPSLGFQTPPPII